MDPREVREMIRNKKGVRYSEAFKRQVVQEYEDGATISHLQRKYDIGGNTTIQKWIRKYGIRIPGGSGRSESPTEEIERLKVRIEQLEKAVSRLTVEKLVLESTLEVYQEEYGAIYAKKTDTDHREGEAEGGGGSEPIIHY